MSLQQWWADRGIGLFSSMQKNAVIEVYQAGYQEADEKARIQIKELHDSRNAIGHAFMEFGSDIGVDGPCSPGCEECRQVAKMLDDAEFMCHVEEDKRWWDTEEVTA